LLVRTTARWMAVTTRNKRTKRQQKERKKERREKIQARLWSGGYY
jgi:hypothetical protein